MYNAKPIRALQEISSDSHKLLPKKTAAKPEDNLGAAIYNGKIFHEG
jgi:hypothetical protein